MEIPFVIFGLFLKFALLQYFDQNRRNLEITGKPKICFHTCLNFTFIVASYVQTYLILHL